MTLELTLIVKKQFSHLGRVKLSQLPLGALSGGGSVKSSARGHLGHTAVIREQLAQCFPSELVPPLVLWLSIPVLTITAEAMVGIRLGVGPDHPFPSNFRSSP